jgi:thioesterase domain-containing protein
VYGVELLSAGGASISAIDLAKTARYCLDEIRSLQAAGPYHLAGHSFGGLLAFEIAQQLTAAGERVAFLGMFDTRAPGTRIRATLPERAAIHYQNLRGAPSLERQDYLRERARSILIRLAENELLRRLLSALHVLPQDASALNRIASRIYAPRRYPGKVTLFRSQERSWYVHQDPTEGWQAYAAGLEIHDVPGDHASMLRDPHVSKLAQTLKDCLAAAGSLSPDAPRGATGDGSHEH